MRQDLEKRVADLEARIQTHENRLNALLDCLKMFAAKRYIELPPEGGKVRIYRIPVAYKDEEGQIIPMEFLTPDGVKTLTHLNVFCIEEPAPVKKNGDHVEP